MTAEQDKQREIDRLRAQIANEYQAIKNDAQGLTGADRHAFVASGMKVLWGYFEELVALVGSHAEAMALVIESFDTTPPTFLQVGPIFLSVACIVSVSLRPDGSVMIENASGYLHNFSGEEASLFLSLFKKHSDEGHLIVES